MSRGFVKEEDQEEVPIVLPRPFLPAGVPNYVTVEGMRSLNEEKESLLAEKENLKTQTNKDNRVQINHITAKLNLLLERISSAKVVDSANNPQDKILFGAKVSLFQNDEKSMCEYQIVGVDEADVTQNKISFLSPIAKLLLNKKVGDEIILKTPKGVKNMTIKSVKY